MNEEAPKPASMKRKPLSVPPAKKKPIIAIFQARITLHDETLQAGPTALAIEDIIRDALTVRGYDAVVSLLRTDR